MKNTGKILAVFLSLIAVLSLFACGGGDGRCENGCVDKNLDNVCDVCNKEMPAAVIEDLALVAGGKANFQIVIAKNASSDIRMAIDKSIVKPMKTNSGITVNPVTEGSNADTPQEIEILVGDVANRGDEYLFPRSVFGSEGYTVRIVGKKVVINAGSDKVLKSTIESFAKNVLRATSKSVTNVTMTKDDMKTEVISDYDITALKLNGSDMKGYVIATDLTNKLYKSAALKIRDTVYEKTGYYFEVVSKENAPEKTIYLNKADKVFGEESFNATVSDKALVISCSFDNMLTKAVDAFIEETINGKTGIVNFSGTVFEKDISVVYYEDFGAVGNGIADDFKALYDTHVFANECGQTVMATAGKTYYLCDSKMGTATIKTIPIKTNVDWNGATIIVDDRNLSGDPDHATFAMASTNIFEILPDDAHAKFDITDKSVLESIVDAGLNPKTTTVNLGLTNWDGDVMIIPYSSSHKVFRRLNYSQFTGNDMHEIIVVKANGEIDPSTPIMFNYSSLYKIEVYKLDADSAITVENGNIRTLSSKLNHMDSLEGYTSSYIKRGINVKRSYTTVKNIKHSVVEGITLKERIEEGIEGASYQGMFCAEYAHQVTFDSCEIPGRMCYNNQSTYNIKIDRTNKVVFKNCVQPNFWVTVDPLTYEITNATDKNGNKTNQNAILGRTAVSGKTLQWGVGGSNYCKNLEYIDSTLTRYDAHAGLYNGKIIGCNITDIELTGFGQFILEDTTLYSLVSPTSNKDNYSNVIIPMRADYGYTWDGEILIKDVDFYILTSHSTYIMSHGYRNWYFGYTAAAANLVVDNLTLYDRETGEKLTGTEIYHMRFRAKTGSNDSRRMHLLDSGVDALFSVLDTDGDGYVDEPLYDINRDGVVNEADNIDIDGVGGKDNTSILYSAAYNVENTDRRGVKHTAVGKSAVTANLCIVRPPEYYKILNNNNNYKFVIWDTSGQGISDGMWYSNTDSMNGFFGGTKFYYGQQSYFVGTDPQNMPTNSTFVIKTPQ